MRKNKCNSLPEGTSDLRPADFPPPLDLLRKYFAITEWCRPAFELTKSEIRILVRLIEMQNPETGQCNPGLERLMSETNLSSRSIYSGLAKLERCGAIIRPIDPGPDHRHFIIPRVEPRTARNCSKAEKSRPKLQKLAQEDAVNCSKNMKRTAPIKEKGKTKRKSSSAPSELPTNFATVNLTHADKLSLTEWHGWVTDFTNHDWDALLTALSGSGFFQFPSRFPPETETAMKTASAYFDFMSDRRT